MAEWQGNCSDLAGELRPSGFGLLAQVVKATYAQLVAAAVGDSFGSTPGKRSQVWAPLSYRQRQKTIAEQILFSVFSRPNW